MGFVSESNSAELTAFYTQIGRKYILDGSESDKKVVYFSLSDSDTNYTVASNDRVNTSEKNYLDNGLVPDLSGNYDSCIKTVTDGTDTKSLIFYKKPTTYINSTKEFRFFQEFKNDFDGKNDLHVKINLKKYIDWYKINSTYSINNNDPYNINQPSLSSPFIKFYDYFGIYDTIDNTIDKINISDFYFELSPSDYKVFEQLNRFVLDKSLPINNQYNLVKPDKLYTSSPLSFIFNQSDDAIVGGGKCGVIMNNRSYGVTLTNKTTNVTEFYTLNEFSSGITIDDTITYDINSAVSVNYYQSLVLNTEIYKMRDITEINKFSNSFNNQYLKSYVKNTKSLATFETELLINFIKNRVDLFYNTIPSKYISKPVTIYLKDINDKIKFASLKVQFYYDENETVNVTPNMSFID